MKFTIKVPDCPRCGGDHEEGEGLVFAPLTRPGPEGNFWGTCPASGEPILATIRPMVPETMGEAASGAHPA